MFFKGKASIWLLVLFLGLWSGGTGCSPAGTPPKAEKETKVSLSPQAMEHFRQGHKFLADQKLDEALKEFQETVRLAPDSSLANYWLGKAYFYHKDKDQAEKAFTKVLQLDPKNYHALAALGRLYSFDKAKLDQAEKYLQKALEESPDNLDAHFDLGRIEAMKGDQKKAMREFTFIFAKEQEFALYHFEMGRILEAWGEKKGALQQYQRALVLNPRFANAEQAAKRLEEAGKDNTTKTQTPPVAKPQTPEKKPAR
jgi:tetratricopeptide (TPR) repeat protein